MEGSAPFAWYRSVSQLIPSLEYLEVGMKGKQGNIKRLERVLLRIRDRESKYLTDTRWDKYSLLQLIDEATDELIDSLVYMERLRDALLDGGDSKPLAGSD